MTSLWWPGDHRADDLMTGPALLSALTRVEQAWLDALVESGIAPSDAGADLTGVVGAADLDQIAVAAEAGGNPVIPLVALLRERVPGPAATWLHRGLTSQDVLDSATMLCARDAVRAVRRQVDVQVLVLADLVRSHRDTPMVARTLTQHAVPTTFAARVATWLHGVLDAGDTLAETTFPVQVGGAAGTLSGLVEIGGTERARLVRAALAPALGLTDSASWHTRRSPVTRIADAAVGATDAWSRIARDVLELGRPEIGELAEGSGGGSSTMPQKANPVLSTLVHRAGLAAPSLAASLHVAAASQVDDRADGAWHAEWEPFATLLRRTVVAGAQAAALLTDLRVDREQMAARLIQVDDAVRAEQRGLAALAGHPPEGSYLGLTDDLVDQALHRAAQREETR